MALSCTDEEYVGIKEGEMANVNLSLYLPSPSEVSTRAITSVEEAKVECLKVLVFDENNNYLPEWYREENNITQSTSEDGASTINCSIPLQTTTKSYSVVVLANLKYGKEDNNNLFQEIAEPKSGDTKLSYLKSLQYSLSQGEKWNATGSDNYSRFPMYGEYKGNISADKLSINLLRALARVNVSLAPGVDNFTLTSVSVHNSLTSGCIVPEGVLVSDQVTMPTIPSEARKNESLFYEVKGNACINEIYIPEAAAASSSSYDGVYLTVGGQIEGVDKLYRVYMTETGKADGKPLPVLRNHTYKIFVKKVGAGLNDIEVSITPMSDVVMRNPNEQYTLVVDKNRLSFAATATSQHTMNVHVTTSYFDGWKIKDGSVKGEWFTVSQDGDKVVVAPKANNNSAGLNGSFIITAGALEKTIIVEQQEPETANCYIATDKEGSGTSYQLIVSLKGNGSAGMMAENHKLSGDYKLEGVHHIGIIWETGIRKSNSEDLTQEVEAGLVTVDNEGIVVDGIASYTVHDPNQIGGNALIGVFNASNKLLWSWHIWVVPDYANGYKEEKWMTGYTFLDRYLGATTNTIGVESLGLLYQWGRKDPLIGVGEIVNSSSNKKGTPSSRAFTHLYNNYSWGDDAGSATGDINFTIENPTKILQQGLCANVENDGQYLWGTNKGLEITFGQNITNSGTKTIYDPCPIGYRIPPVDAFVFRATPETTLSNSTYGLNWGSNVCFVPNNMNEQSSGENGGGNGSASYKASQKAYGFYINYGASHTLPSGMLLDGDKNYYPTPVADATTTWMPVSGVYKKNMNSFALVDEHNSVSVNSIVWTNSPIKDDKSKIRPAAMFLHGTESSLGNGRHLHQLNEGGTLAASPEDAGAIRCVRDINKDFSHLNQVPDKIYLGNKGTTDSGELISVNEPWEIIYLGADWFTVSPQQGNAGRHTLTFTATKDGSNRSAEMQVKFKNSGEVKTVKVYQNTEKPTPSVKLELTYDGKLKLENNDTKTIKVNVDKGVKWKATVSDNGWLYVKDGNNQFATSTQGIGPGDIIVKRSGNTKGNTRKLTVSIDDTDISKSLDFKKD